MTRREYAIIMEQFADMNNKLNDIMEALELSPTKHEDKEWFTEQELADELHNTDFDMGEKNVVCIPSLDGDEDYLLHSYEDIQYGTLVYNAQSDKWFIMDNDDGHLYKISKYDNKYIHSGGFQAGSCVTFTLKNRESAVDGAVYAVIL